MEHENSLNHKFSKYANRIVLSIFSYLMGNLELIPLCFALQIWFDAGNRWEYWVTVCLVLVCKRISNSYKRTDKKSSSNNY